VNAVVCIASPHPSRACKAALALACGLGDRFSVTVLSAGHETTNPALAESQWAGVARAVHLCDPALADADDFILGLVLAAAARQLQAEVIFAGTATDDEGRGLVPAMLAQHLGASILSNVEGVAFDPAEAHEIIAIRRVGGQRLQLAFRFPVVLTVAPPALPLKNRASIDAPPPIECLTLAQLGIDPERLVPLPNLLGSLESGKGKPESLPSVDALVARWLGKS
jgi:electron transfer flavoprotein beta subunit